MDRRAERLDTRDRGAFGIRGRTWPLSSRGLQPVCNRARRCCVAVRTDRARHRRHAARPAIAADAADLEPDDFSSNRHPALSFCLSMISAQTLRVCREGKPVIHPSGRGPRACFSGSCSRERRGGRLTRPPLVLDIRQTKGYLVKGLLGDLAADFAARIGCGMHVHVVLAGHQVGGLRVRQRGAAFGGT